jgi:LysM repeat protein
MDRFLFRLFILSFLFCALPKLAAAESQFWKVRPGDNFEIIAMTLEIPKEEIKTLNPGVLDSNVQIGQKLKLPLRAYEESKKLEAELGVSAARIGKLEKDSADLQIKIASAESRLLWQPIWFWGFWMFCAILAFIVVGAYWLFRQTHPQVFEQPHERSLRDLQESQTRVRSTLPRDEEAASDRIRWQPSLKRVPHTG